MPNDRNPQSHRVESPTGPDVGELNEETLDSVAGGRRAAPSPLPTDPGITLPMEPPIVLDYPEIYPAP